MFHLIFHTEVGTFKSAKVSQKVMEDTFQNLKDYAGKLLYFNVKDVNDLPIFFPNGLDGVVITVEKAT
jgi:hypothetical protein